MNKYNKQKAANYKNINKDNNSNKTKRTKAKVENNNRTKQQQNQTTKTSTETSIIPTVIIAESNIIKRNTTNFPINIKINIDNHRLQHKQQQL